MDRRGNQIRQKDVLQDIEEDVLEGLKGINKEIRRLKVVDDIVLDEIEEICEDIKEIIER